MKDANLKRKNYQTTESAMSDNYDTISGTTEQVRIARHHMWALIYSVNGKTEGFWRHGVNGVPRLYNAHDRALSAGGRQIKEAGIRGVIGLRPVRVEVRIKILPESAVSNGD